MSGDNKVDDPFDILGHGIISYFKMIEYMICVFFICTILFIPTMYMYYQGNANNDMTLRADSIMLGNLGHSESKCIH